MNLSQVKNKFQSINWKKLKARIIINVFDFLRNVTYFKNEVLDNFQELENDIADKVYEWVEFHARENVEFSVVRSDAEVEPNATNPFNADSIPDLPTIVSVDESSQIYDWLTTNPDATQRAILQQASENYLNPSEDV
jgi:hypothetical protein